jgi:Tol biopolymer transport system component
MLFVLLPAGAQDDPPPLAFIGRVRDTTGDNLVDVDDVGALYLVSTAGGDPVALTKSLDVMGAVWSPTGDGRLAFYAHRGDRNGNASIYVTRTDCDESDDCIVQLTDRSSNDRHPAWSPDGAQLAFASNDGAGAALVEVIDADCAASEEGCAASRRVLTQGSGLYLDLAWSPDGGYIAYLALEDTHPDGVLNRLDDYAALHLLEVESGDVRELAPADSAKGGLAWSPDGQYLAYHALEDTDGDGFVDALYDRAGIFVFDVRAPAAPYRVTGAATHATDPAWSPMTTLLTQGRLVIAYSALTDTNGDGWLDTSTDSPNIYVLDFDGAAWGEPRALTGAGTLDYTPAWSPDGEPLAFVGIQATGSGGTGTAVTRRGRVMVVEAGCDESCTPRALSPVDMDAFAPVWPPQ